MARISINLSIEGLEKLRDNLEQMNNEKEEFMLKTVKNLASRLLRKVILRTPAITGELRNAWKIERVTRLGDVYQVTVVNSKVYASYVEFGHRQKVGRYVPAIGRRLKTPWVNGRFMLAISENELSGEMEEIISKRIENWLKRLGGS